MFHVPLDRNHDERYRDQTLPCMTWVPCLAVGERPLYGRPGPAEGHVGGQIPPYDLVSGKAKTVLPGLPAGSTFGAQRWELFPSMI